MVTTEFEEALEELKDSELLRYAVKYVVEAYDERNAQRDEAQDILDSIYMECIRRGKEWIFDKAQEASSRSAQRSAAVVHHEVA
jgi:hypothetical protein